MFPTPPIKPRTIRAMRRRATPPPAPTRLAPEPEPAPEPELSNYELIERRSRELEIERGTSQPPDADTPLLFSKPTDASNTSERPQSGARRSEPPAK
jgi:hypothetical protein